MSDLIVQCTITPLIGSPVGAFTFHHVQGLWIPSLMDVGDDARRLGDDGTLTQSTGSVATAITASMQSAFTSKSLALAFATNCYGLSNAMVSVADAWGRTIPRARITNPQATPRAWVGGSLAGVPCIVVVQCQFTFERQTDL